MLMNTVLPSYWCDLIKPNHLILILVVAMLENELVDKICQHFLRILRQSEQENEQQLLLLLNILRMSLAHCENNVSPFILIYLLKIKQQTIRNRYSIGDVCTQANIGWDLDRLWTDALSIDRLPAAVREMSPHSYTGNRACAIRDKHVTSLYI